MNIIIPLGGNGIRFKNEDYKLPKVLTPVLGKEIIFWVLESIKATEHDCITIIYNRELEQFNFENRLKRKFNLKFNFIKLPYQTSGPVDTVLYGLSKLTPDQLDQHMLIHDGDSFLKNNVVTQLNNENSCIFYTYNDNPKPLFSYISLDENGRVWDIREKYKISNFANIGCYSFSSGNMFIKYADKCDKLSKEIYISHVYEQMIKSGEVVKGIKVDDKDFVCLGTPSQAIDFSFNFTEKNPLRFCFDLDNTLVTYPQTAGDYSTVLPIQKNIQFLKNLKSKGHYIIIYTARRMKTHGGNVSKVISDIGRVTFDTLDKYDIPYDEIHFGKPYADYYIDDLAINAYCDLEKETGVYLNTVSPRSFNQIDMSNTDYIVKTSTNSLDGEIFYYKNIPENLRDLFPKYINNENNSLTLEKIKGQVLSHTYSHKEMKTFHLDILFKTLDRIHDESSNEGEINIYDNYSRKLIHRYKYYDYSKFPLAFLHFEKINKKLIEYESKNLGIKTMIHGDFVFSNILMSDDGIKLIDMRGKVGDKLSIYGDKFYDYAKLYQSLLGYDFILNDKAISICYTNEHIKYFESYFESKFGSHRLEYLKYLTAGLLFSLIPLHDNNKCMDYYELIYSII